MDRFTILETPGILFLSTGVDPIFALCSALTEVGADAETLDRVRQARALDIERARLMEYAFEVAPSGEALVADLARVTAAAARGAYEWRQELAGLGGVVTISTHGPVDGESVAALWRDARHLVNWSAALEDPVLRICLLGSPVADQIRASHFAASPAQPQTQPEAAGQYLWRRDGFYAVAARDEGSCLCGNTHLDLTTGRCTSCQWVISLELRRGPLWGVFIASRAAPSAPERIGP